jgi:HAD superfamily hydrolase (TIGR01509 family)
MRPDLVIFDCDGVLVDSEPTAARIVSENLTRHGLPLSPEDCDRLFTGGTMAGVGDRARDLGADLPATWVDEVYAELYAALREGVDPIPGVPALLDRLDAEEVAWCVASNGSDEKMDITLGGTGLAPRIGTRRFSAHTVGIAKPDPGLFLHAARAMGAAPGACVVIEDSASGAEAARRAGMRCLAYAPSGDAARLTAQGAERIRSMAEVPRRLGLDPR